ncbi:TPA: hypothetical protein IAA68_08100 [Candidatus Galligastranaerophilus faecipullorum]|nr:hypothetical protein [Candidatus Galligastranaerophilus faecipullorum]
MKMHNYISLNLLSVSSYLTLVMLWLAEKQYQRDIAYAEANNLDVDVYGMLSLFPMAILFLGFIYLAVFLFVCFLIELFVRVRFKKWGGCIRFKNEVLRIVHAILFYLGIALVPFVNPLWFML